MKKTDNDVPLIAASQIPSNLLTCSYPQISTHSLSGKESSLSNFLNQFEFAIQASQHHRAKRLIEEFSSGADVPGKSLKIYVLEALGLLRDVSFGCSFISFALSVWPLFELKILQIYPV